MRDNFFHRFEHIDDEMLKVEVNLDDITGEMLGYVMDKLFDAGANDVFYTPIYMKKNRPGVMLQLLCHLSKLEIIKDILFKETTTLGVRYYPISVYRLERKFQKVTSDWGEVTVKIGMYQGSVIQIAPEYEECKIIAETFGVPLKKVYQNIWSQLDDEDQA